MSGSERRCRVSGCREKVARDLTLFSAESGGIIGLCETHIAAWDESAEAKRAAFQLGTWLRERAADLRSDAEESRGKAEAARKAAEKSKKEGEKKP